MNVRSWSHVLSATPDAMLGATVCGLLIALGHLAFISNAYGEGPVSEDPLATWVPDDLSSEPSSVTFGSTSVPAVPADFFYTGSNAFTGTVALRGVPLDPSTQGDTSTVVRRPNGDAVAPSDPPGTVGTVPIELVQLHLVSAQPIVVTGTQDPQLWEVRVSLSATVAAPLGVLTATKTHDNGGTFDFTLFVQPLFTFTRLSDGTVRTLDTGAEDQPPLELSAVGTPFVHFINPALEVVVSPDAQFVPGVNEVEPGNIKSQEVVPFTATTSSTATAAAGLPDLEHTVCIPVSEPKRCIYKVTCAAGECDLCPLGCDALCQAAACPNLTCATSLSTTCGGNACCLKLELVECRVPDGEPVCPNENSCPCDASPGACCLGDGTCLDDQTACECEALGGRFMGAGSVCGPFGGCCLNPTTCTDMNEICCVQDQGGSFRGELCRDPTIGTCCFSDGSSFPAVEDCCDGSFVPGDGGTIEGCCLEDRTCVNMPRECCQSFNGSPTGQLCSPKEQCCQLGGVCTDTAPECCDFGLVVPGTCDPPTKCCLGDGYCIDSDPECCVARRGTPQSGSCDPRGCCFSDLSGAVTCIDTDPTCCELQDGLRAGFECGDVLGCCNAFGGCNDMSTNCCAAFGGTVLPGRCATGSTLEACCFRPSGECFNADMRCCELATATSPAGPAMCSSQQACCRPDGSCRALDPACCRNAFGDTPVSGGCDPGELCCLPDGSCLSTNPECCEVAGGLPQGASTLGAACTPTGACCVPDGSCLATLPACCQAVGGIYLGDDIPCGGDNNGNGIDDACEALPPPIDCCLPDGPCITTTAANCGSENGRAVPACLGDTDGDGTDEACECFVAEPGIAETIQAGDGSQIVSTKNRFLSVSTGDSASLNRGLQHAIKVTITNMPGGFTDLIGRVLWAGETSFLSSTPGDDLNAGVGSADTRFLRVSGLQCDPLFQDWTDLHSCRGGGAGVNATNCDPADGGACGGNPALCQRDAFLHMHHPLIVPGAEYRVEVLDSSCDPCQAASFDPNPLILPTSQFGDVSGGFLPSPDNLWSGPDGNVGVANDVLPVLDALLGKPVAPIKSRSEAAGFGVQPVDGAIRIGDALVYIDAALGKPFGGSLMAPVDPPAACPDPCAPGAVRVR